MRRVSAGIVLNTLSKRANRLGIPAGQRIKLQVEADSGVSFAVASANPSSPEGFDPNTAVCVATKVFKTEVECEAPVNPVFVIVDGRGVLTAASAILSHGLTAKNAIAQNKVNISLYEWQCVTWCQTQTPAPTPKPSCLNGYKYDADGNATECD
jgi:hypothetical protein